MTDRGSVYWGPIVVVIVIVAMFFACVALIAALSR